MKKQIIKFLEWLIRLFGPSTKEAITAWPFPVGEEPKPKTKPRVAKATTRPVKKAPTAIRTVAKKATTVAKKTTKKAK